MIRATLSRWLPSRAPERWDVALIGTALFIAGLNLSRADQVAWLWVIVGIVVNALVFGPFTTSAVGQRIGNWLRRFDSIGQKSVIALVILLVVAVMDVTMPGAIGRGFVTGGCLFIALLLTANLLSSRNQPQESHAAN